MKIVLSYSGGLDSTTALYYWVKKRNAEVYPIFYHYGQKNEVEENFAKWNVERLQNEGYLVHDLKYIDMSFLVDVLSGSSALVEGGEDIPDLESVLGEPQVPTYVPFRNLIFTSVSAAYAESVGADVVSLGIQSVDAYSGYWDTTLEFAKRVDKVFELNRQHRIHVVAPFVNIDKAREIIIGTHLGVDYSKTWTSYKVVRIEEDGTPVAWADAPNSRERIMAFAKVGLKDPIKYDKEINWEKIIEEYQQYDVDKDYEGIIVDVDNTVNKQLWKEW